MSLQGRRLELMPSPLSCSVQETLSVLPLPPLSHLSVCPVQTKMDDDDGNDLNARSRAVLYLSNILTCGVFRSGGWRGCFVRVLRAAESGSQDDHQGSQNQTHHHHHHHHRPKRVGGGGGLGLQVYCYNVTAAADLNVTAGSLAAHNELIASMGGGGGGGYQGFSFSAPSFYNRNASSTRGSIGGGGGFGMQWKSLNGRGGWGNYGEGGGCGTFDGDGNGDKEEGEERAGNDRGDDGGDGSTVADYRIVCGSKKDRENTVESWRDALGMAEVVMEHCESNGGRVWYSGGGGGGGGGGRAKQGGGWGVKFCGGSNLDCGYMEKMLQGAGGSADRDHDNSEGGGGNKEDVGEAFKVGREKCASTGGDWCCVCTVARKLLKKSTWLTDDACGCASRESEENDSEGNEKKMVKHDNNTHTFTIRDRRKGEEVCNGGAVRVGNVLGFGASSKGSSTVDYCSDDNLGIMQEIMKCGKGGAAGPFQSQALLSSRVSSPPSSGAERPLLSSASPMLVPKVNPSSSFSRTISSSYFILTAVTFCIILRLLANRMRRTDTDLKVRDDDEGGTILRQINESTPLV